MRFIALLFTTCSFFPGCEPGQSKQPSATFSPAKHDSIPSETYDQVKETIVAKRKQFSSRFSFLDDSAHNEIKNFWVNMIGNELYNQWKNTPWDFNGTTTQPGQGSIACGYFVTTILQDMNVKLNRIKLSTCASSEMMKSLVPGQRLKNLSYLDYTSFNDSLKEIGKGVFIIGLDFHTGLIVNDGTENWFIHSNYIGRKGVTKESVMSSEALKSSKTRWIVSLTNDKSFLLNWLRK